MPPRTIYTAEENRLRKNARTAAWLSRTKAAGKCRDGCGRDKAPGVSRCVECTVKHNARSEPNYQLIKDQVFAAYGGYKCACCGMIDTHEFFCIDHIDGDGHKHRGSTGKRILGINMYLWLRRNGYPSDYQVLCHSCNVAKGTQTECPHQVRERTTPKSYEPFMLTF